jgi:hypothetical protein
MAHEMIEEGKLLKMIYSVLQHSILATETGNSATRPDNSTTIGRTATETVDPPPTQRTTSTATTTGDRKQSKRPSESHLQGDPHRQKTHGFNNPGLLTPTMIHTRSTPTNSNRQEDMTTQSLTNNTPAAPRTQK